jgi:hypothetical protein
MKIIDVGCDQCIYVKSLRDFGCYVIGMIKVFWLYLVREFYIAQVVLVDICIMFIEGLLDESDT